MKKFLFILILSTRILCGHTQTSKDTICFSIPVAQKLVTAYEQKKILEQQMAITEQRILNFQSIIQNLQDKDKISVSTYEAEIKVMKEQLALTVDAIAGKNKEIRRMKRRVLFSKIAGGIGIGIMGWLYLNK